jgi:hypothetical protein
LPTVSLAPSASAFLGLTFLTALLATLSAFALTLGLAEVFGVERSTPFAAAETAFFAVCLGFAAAFLAVAVAFFAVAFFAGAFFLAAGFLVMPAALVREPAPEVVAFFFFWGEGAAAGLGARALAFSCGGGEG